MSNIVLPMIPVSWGDLDQVANAFLGEVHAEALAQPIQLPLEALTSRLQHFDIHVYPLPDDDDDLEGCLAYFDWENNWIMMQESAYEHLFSSGPNSHHPRSTFLHELGHAILHRKQMIRFASDQQLLRRALTRANQKIPAYRNPEDQAWCLAGCIGMPLVHLKHRSDLTLHDVALMFGVSTVFAARHIERFAQVLPRPLVASANDFLERRRWGTRPSRN